MGEHKFNPVARAAAEGKQIVRALDIGEGCAVLGLQLVPKIVDDEMVVQVIAIGGRDSPIAGFVPVPAYLCDIVKAPLSTLRRVFQGGEQGPTADARQPATESAPPDASPSLVVVP